jgi:hypothetical protein
MTDREGSLMLARLATAAIAVFATLSIAVTWVASVSGSAGANGFDFRSLLVAPLLAGFCLGPGALIFFMASRSRSWLATGIALVLSAGFAFIVVAMDLTPWHYGKWHGRSNDASMELFLVLLFYAWPATFAGLALWAALNPRRLPR